MTLATARMQLRCNPKSARLHHAALKRAIIADVNPLRFLVDAFVNTFGITRPTPRQEQLAGRFIAIMLVVVVLALATVALILRNAMSH